MSMNIRWKKTEEKFVVLEEAFLSLGKKAIELNHYDFYDLIQDSVPEEITLQDCREFLNDGRVAQYIQQEFDSLKQSEFRKIVSNIKDSKSVGQAQIVNSLSKIIEAEDKKKDGPIFVYCYIPLSEEQQAADNVIKLDKDPFRRS